MSNNSLESRYSIKRSREELTTASSTSKITTATVQNDKERPLKRSNSARNSLVFLSSPPSTPKKSSRHFSGKRNRILTSFKNAFTTNSKNTYQSPISDGESSPSTTSLSNSNVSSAGSPFSFYTPPSPNLESSPIFDFTRKESVCKTLKLDQRHQQSGAYDSDNDSMDYKLSGLSIKVAECHPIFHIPEIVSKIISYVDSSPSLPHEVSPIRRRPLSYQHALLIYKDERKALKVWREACEASAQNNGNPSTAIRNPNSLFSCLLVNKLWYRVTLEVASNKLFFSDERKWASFVDKTNRTKPLVQRSNSNTSLFIMHKLTKVKQADLDIVAPSISGGLEWIEMYICPKVLPPPIMLSGSLLKKLILPGSRVVNDSFLRLVAMNCPKLEVVDLRACEMISDQGICLIAQYCSKLISLNLGRHSNGDLITDNLLAILSRNTKIETLGLAGCSITDRGLWDLAIHCTDSLSRLSLNNCTLLTNNSLPRIIKDGYLSGLVVLEIRNILNITDLKPLVNYKKMKEINGHNVLIEGCEVLEYRMREEEWKFEMKKSAKILNDILLWANDSNDSDVQYSQLMRSHRS